MRKHVAPQVPALQTSASIFLILRRMRTPLIVLILIFAVSVLGLTLVPGVDGDGNPHRLSIFDAFYFMSYTATTIGFGEIPHAFTPEQRLWVTFTIYLSVIGWAYAVGSLLSLSQDRSFRRALALQRFVRAVRRLREPFYLVIGHGSAGQRLTRSLDGVSLPFVVIDVDERRITELDLGTYHFDAPAIVGDGKDPRLLAAGGLTHPHCAGVLALTDDDEANLAVAMSAALLHPELRVVARTSSRAVADRMRGFGTPEVINAFDRFGDHLRILLRSPASYQLMMWLTSPAGTELAERRTCPQPGRWIVFGRAGFGPEVAADLRAEGMAVTVAGPSEPDGYDLEALLGAGVEAAVGVVAATGNDITNLSVLETARELNPEIFTVARQNSSGNSALYRALGTDFILVPGEVILHETLARLANPLLLSFLQQVPHQGEAWVTALSSRIGEECGSALPDLWRVALTDEEAPALAPLLGGEPITIGDVLRSPDDRSRLVPAVPLLLVRDGERILAPAADLPLEFGDELLFLGRTSSRRVLDWTLRDPTAVAYVLSGRVIPAGWLWRKLTRTG